MKHRLNASNVLLLLARLDTRVLLRIDLLAGEVDLGAEGDDDVD